MGDHGGLSRMSHNFSTYRGKESENQSIIPQLKNVIDMEHHKKMIFYMHKKEIRHHAENELRKIRSEVATQQYRSEWWS